MTQRSRRRKHARAAAVRGAVRLRGGRGPALGRALLRRAGPRALRRRRPRPRPRALDIQRGIIYIDVEVRRTRECPAQTLDQPDWENTRTVPKITATYYTALERCCVPVVSEAVRAPGGGYPSGRELGQQRYGTRLPSEEPCYWLPT